MSSITPIHLTYDQSRGQSAIAGDGYLALALEKIGGGLSTQGEWKKGGPFVVTRPESGYRVVGWIRGLATHEVDRAGGWEAWGLQAPKDVDLELWPTYWNDLEKGTEQLSYVATQLELQEPGRMLPLESDDLLRMLTTLHLTATGNGLPRPARIRLLTATEIPLLAWIWAFGPARTSEATLGPPRLIASSPTITYEGAISTAHDGIVAGQSISPYLAEVMDLVAQGSLSEALENIRDFREQPFAIQRALLKQGTAGVSLPAPVFVTEQVPPAQSIGVVSMGRMEAPPSTADAPPRGSITQFLRKPIMWRSWKVDVVVVLTTLTFLMVGAQTAWLWFNRPTASDQAAQAAPQPAPAVASEAIVKNTTVADIGDRAAAALARQNRILDLLLANAAASQITVDPGLAARIEELRQMRSWPLADRLRLQNAILQLELVKGNCTKTRTKIDGFPAAGFGREITDCRSDAAASIDQGLTDWLASRESASGSQP